MKIKYIGRKEALILTRPELGKKYTFKGDIPVEVTQKDGLYLTEEYPRSFEIIEETKSEKDKK